MGKEEKKIIEQVELENNEKRQGEQQKGMMVVWENK